MSVNKTIVLYQDDIIIVSEITSKAFIGYSIFNEKLRGFPIKGSIILTSPIIDLIINCKPTKSKLTLALAITESRSSAAGKMNTSERNFQRKLKELYLK